MDVIELPDQSDNTTEQQPSVKIHAEIASKINFACHQSAFPLLRDLSIENLDEEQRIARHHGFKKAGSRIRERVLGIAKSRRETTVEPVGRFYWQKGTVKDKRTQVRYQIRNDEMRNVDFICKEELQAIDSELGLRGDVVALSRALGLTRLREVSRRRLELALEDEHTTTTLD